MALSLLKWALGEPSADRARKEEGALSAAQVVTDATFEETVKNSGTPILVDFWAPWCGPCKMLAPVLDEIATEYSGRVKVAKVNVDDNAALAQRYRIQGIPTLLYFANGEPRDQVVGLASKKAILAKLLALVAAPAPS